MDPETGTFHPIGLEVGTLTEEVAAAAQQIASGEIGKDWPVFTIGEILDIKGYQFRIMRINMGSMVIMPIPAKGLENPRSLMLAMTGRGT